MAPIAASGLSSLQVEILDVKGVDSLAPLYLHLQLGEHRLKANVKSKSDRAEAVVFTQKKLADLYKENLTFTLYDRETNKALGQSSIIVKKLMIGKKVDRYYELGPLAEQPETTTKKNVVQVRLAVELLGRLRREFRFLQDVVTQYYSAVDRGVDMAVNAGHTVQPYVVSRWSLPLLAPFGLLFVGALPFIGVALTIGLPVLFPLILIGFIGAITLLIASLVVGFSSRSGRARINSVTEPILKKLTHTSTGQQLLYETGPRPSPYKVIKTFAPKGVWERLAVSLILDVIGSSSYIVPVLGEFSDLAWAPTQALIMAAMYSETSPYMHYVGLVEELLPFTDIIPSATLAWLRENGATLVKEAHSTMSIRQQQQQQRRSNNSPQAAAQSTIRSN